MSQTLRDFIAARESEIRKQVADLRAELRELRAAKVAIDTSGPSSPQDASKITIKEQIISVLEDQERGASSAEIISMIEANFSNLIPHSSISPQLSRLKQLGVLRLQKESKLWSLKKYEFFETNKEEPFDAETANGSTNSSGDSEVREQGSSANSPEGANPFVSKPITRQMLSGVTLPSAPQATVKGG